MMRALLVATVLVLVPATAAAQSAAPQGATPPAAKVDASELPPSAAKRLILELQKSVRKEKLSPEVVARPVGEAIRAADRARGARDAGDARNSTLLNKLAEQWASAGKAVLRAVRAERAAKAEAKRLTELATKVKRAEALLHEQQSRFGRLRAELKRLQDKNGTATGPDNSGTKGAPKTPNKGAP